MKLREYLNGQETPDKEIIIGKETVIAGYSSLLLSVYETECNYINVDDEIENDDWDEPHPDSLARLIVISEYRDDCECCDDDWDMSEINNRERLLQELNENSEICLDEVREFRVNGKQCRVFYSEIFDMESCDYATVANIKEIVDKGLVSESWLEKDVADLTAVVYDLFPDAMEAGWGPDALIETSYEHLPESGRIGTVLQLECGHYDTPKSMIIQNETGDMISLKIFGVYPFDPEDGFIDDPDFVSDYDDLFCDEDMLIVEYITDDDINLDFYTPEYLELPADDCDFMGVIGYDYDSSYRKISVAGYVPEDYDPYGSVTVELFSYNRD